MQHIALLRNTPSFGNPLPPGILHEQQVGLTVETLSFEENPMKRLGMLVLLVLTSAAAFGQGNRILPKGSEIKVRTDTAIPAKPAVGSAYSARVSEDIS